MSREEKKEWTRWHVHFRWVLFFSPLSFVLWLFNDVVEGRGRRPFFLPSSLAHPSFVSPFRINARCYFLIEENACGRVSVSLPVYLCFCVRAAGHIGSRPCEPSLLPWLPFLPRSHCRALTEASQWKKPKTKWKTKTKLITPFKSQARRVLIKDEQEENSVEHVGRTTWHFCRTKQLNESRWSRQKNAISRWSECTRWWVVNV